METIMKNGKHTADGTQRWYQNDKIHRNDGPAEIYADGDQRWYQNGKIHRNDGPAETWTNGDQYWYQNDKLHRTDGPAVIWANGSQFWYQNGKEFTEEEFKIHLDSLEFDKMIRELCSGE